MVGSSISFGSQHLTGGKATMVNDIQGASSDSSSAGAGRSGSSLNGARAFGNVAFPNGDDSSSKSTHVRCHFGSPPRRRWSPAKARQRAWREARPSATTTAGQLTSAVPRYLVEHLLYSESPRSLRYSALENCSHRSAII
jgi:hypothetical protein